MAPYYAVMAAEYVLVDSTKATLTSYSLGKAVGKTKSPENSTKLEISGMEGPYMFRKTKTLFCSWTEIIFGICTMK